MDSKDWIVLISVLVGGSGLAGAIVAFFKLKPEAGQILVTTAQGVVIMQTTVIENLQKEVARLHDETEECQKREKALAERVSELERKIIG